MTRRDRRGFFEKNFTERGQFWLFTIFVYSVSLFAFVTWKCSQH